MELNTKFQYTNFIYPYIIDSSKYDKYILRLLENDNCRFKMFEKEKDLDLYNFFLPSIRALLFPTFEYRGKMLKNFNSLSASAKSKIISKHEMACFEYYINENVQGKVDEENGIFFDVSKIEIICFRTGICFLYIQTQIDDSTSFNDVLDFNYRFKTLSSEFSKLRNFEKIKIQTNSFKDVKDIREFIEVITGYTLKKFDAKNYDKIVDSEFYNFSYVCIDDDGWNDKTDFKTIQTDYMKYINILPSKDLTNYSRGKTIKDKNSIDHTKYSKISINKTNCCMFCSGVDTYNYTKLPYVFENQYFYTYILGLYKKFFLKNLNNSFNDYNKIPSMRNLFIDFTKKLWQKEITIDDNGTQFYNLVEKSLGLDELYSEVKDKYEVIYQYLNIEKNNLYYSIIVIILIISLIFNTINIIWLMMVYG